MKISLTNIRSLLMNSKITPVLWMVAILPLLFILKDWHEIRGALLINPHNLKITKGEISTSIVNFMPGKSSGYIYQITYNYEVAGISYDSDQVNFSCIRGEKSPYYAQNYVEKYPVGKRVTVYYKSNEPTFAVLEPYVTYPTIEYLSIYVTVFIIITTLCIMLSIAQNRFKNECQ